jgi:hypothetical protein
LPCEAEDLLGADTESGLVPERLRQCKATATSTGSRCRRWAIMGRQVCAVHVPERMAPPEPLDGDLLLDADDRAVLAVLDAEIAAARRSADALDECDPLFSAWF